MLNDGRDKEREREETRTNGAQTTEVVCALGSRRVRRCVSSPRYVCFFFFILSTNIICTDKCYHTFWSSTRPTQAPPPSTPPQQRMRPCGSTQAYDSQHRAQDGGMDHGWIGWGLRHITCISSPGMFFFLFLFAY